MKFLFAALIVSITASAALTTTVSADTHSANHDNLHFKRWHWGK